MSALDGFGTVTRDWFTGAFAAPTAAQEGAWSSIARGENTLVVAPTGSGKTLAAFLWSIDRLAAEGSHVRHDDESTPGTPVAHHDPLPGGESGEKDDKSGRKGDRPGRRGHGSRPRGKKEPEPQRLCRVVYVSPLKALAVDVERNLRAPLTGIKQTARRLGLPVPEISVAIRSGDTSAEDRRRFATRPSDILITTPESLFLILTSQAREALRGVETVIVDEVHAVAATKRGAHLALSLERLDALLPQPAQRIGLSATVRPVSEVAAFLGGSRPATVVQPPSDKVIEVDVVVPVEDMAEPAPPPPGMDGEPAEHRRSIWPHVEEHLLDLIEAHRSTIVFANSRRLSERLCTRLNELAYEREAVRAETEADDPVHWSAGFGDLRAVWSRAERSGAEPDSPPQTAPDVSGDRRGPTPPRGSIGTPAEMMAQAGASRGAVPEIVRAHHGSVSKEERSQIEEALKSGRLPAVVATSSLELGIDMGSVDLVACVEAPPSVASGLQRIGRAGHQVGAVSRGVIFPKYRGDLIQTAVVAERMKSGQIEELHYPRNPLDVLAQQIVAMTALDEWTVDSLEAVVRKAAPYATLPRSALEATLDMLAGRYPSEEFAELRPRIVWDRVTGTLRGRPGAQRLAVTNGGTIPDRGLFGVFLVGERSSRVGELDEEMVYESRVGDVFVLGATSWRIEDITADRVLVSPAPGQPGKLPFWHGDAPGRPAELGRAIGAFLRELSGAGIPAPGSGSVTGTGAGSHTGGTRATSGATGSARATSGASGPGPGSQTGSARGISAGSQTGGASGTGKPRAAAGRSAVDRVREAGLDDFAIGNLLAYLHEQREATGYVPDDRTLLVERFHDELGDWRVVIHSPYGARVHAPWSLAIGRRLRERYGVDVQAVHSDDGIVLRIPDTLDEAPSDLAAFDADEIEQIVTEELGGSALFSARFRECAGRSLLLPRRTPGRRTPLWQQRQRAAHLLGVASKYASFPVVLETMRECLRDVFDVPGLVQLMRDISARRVRVVEVETGQASPFAASLLFHYVGAFMYEGDAPLAERRAQALALDTNLLAELLGQADLRELLDPDVIAETERELARLDRPLRDAEDLADLLHSHGPLLAEDVSIREGDPAWLTDLERARRAIRVRVAGAEQWAAVEDAWRLRDALGTPLPVGVPQEFLEAPDATIRGSRSTAAPDPIGDLVARHARTRGPFSAGTAAARFGLGVAVVGDALRRLTTAGRVVSGGFRPGGRGEEWCDAGVLRLLRRRSLARLRKEVEPVPPEVLAAFLPAWHGITPSRTRGADRAGAEHDRRGFARDASGRPEPETAGLAGRAGDSPEPATENYPRSGSARAMDALVNAIERLQGAAVPASALETLVLPGRVPGYSPALLDELTASGEVIWSGQGSLPGGDGWVSLYFADTAPLLLQEPSDITMTPLHEQVLDVLGGGGALFFRELSNRITSLALGGTGSTQARSAHAGAQTGPAHAGSAQSRAARAVSAQQGPAQAGSAKAQAGSAQQGSARAGSAQQESAQQESGQIGAPQISAVPDDSALAAALWDLVWSGQVTGDTLAPLRAMLGAGRPAHRPAANRRRRAVLPTRSGPPTVSGRWWLLPSPAGEAAQRAQAQAEVLLERHGVLTRGGVAAERLPGGFSAVYQVLRVFEESGRCRRGYFVEGLGGAQFAIPGAVDRMRSMSSTLPSTPVTAPSAITPPTATAAPTGTTSAVPDPDTAATPAPPAEPAHGALLDGPGSASFPLSVEDARSAPLGALWTMGEARPARTPPRTVVLAAADPANPYGGALPWPDRSGDVTHKPGRKAGALVVLVDGRLVLYVERGGKTLLSFGLEEDLRPAVDALASAVREGALGKLTVERADGTSIVESPLAAELEAAGFHPTPRGLRLRG